MVTVNSLRCPSWCRTDHARTDRFERYIEPVLDLRTHSMDVARISNAAGNVSGEVIVDVAVTDDLTNGGREGPLVSAYGAECMTPTTAVELAAGLLAAVAMLRDDPVLAEALTKIAPRAGKAAGRQVDESLDAAYYDRLIKRHTDDLDVALAARRAALS